MNTLLKNNFISSLFLIIMLSNTGEVLGLPQRFSLGLPSFGFQNCVITKDYRPLCASNLETYVNRSAFLCHRRLFPRLSVIHNGPC
ncbi:hypothetical protein Anas_11127 [Armadillidium nasatum]|uniref:Kazal-like domain-containing protein n=1 Tax=Armadillidium nasatum TaxID=96803 RepID=A0A5N5SJG6_9CRUS|nr:hypothetical protein Anas_11127 [Armadillidium nasatum]